MIPLAEIEAARERLAGAVVRTPLIRLEIDAPAEIYLKLENLQPIGSFKLRGRATRWRSPHPRSWSAGSGRRARATWRRVSPGGLDGSARVHLRRARHCAGDEAGRDQAPGVGDRPGLVRRVVGGLSDAGSRRARGPLRARVQRRSGDGRQRNDRARSRRGPARRRRDRHPVWRRRADVRHCFGSARAGP